jgi:outer membrane biosynthesis protein TonB
MTEESGFSITPRPLVVSLDLELAALSGATLGAQLLADLHARKELDEEQERDAPVGVYSVLALVRERISQLRRVVRDEEDPATLWASHNTVEDPAISGDFSGDIVLFSRASGRVPLVMWRFRVKDWETRKGDKKPKKPTPKKPKRPVSKKPTPKKPVSKKPTPKAPTPKEAAPQVH